MIIDAAVHPFFREPNDIRKYLPPEWAMTLVLPAPWRFAYVPPIDEFPARFMPERGWGGSDPAMVKRQVLDETGIDHAVLLPLGRGLVPDIDLGTALARGINTWLAEEWLPLDRRFLGSIRVNPEDVPGSIAEIQRWTGHPQMVQVVVPLQSHKPYGDRVFLPVWEAASAARLPVAVHAEVAAGVEYWPTVLGFPPKFVDYSVLMPTATFFHLASLISEGVFERYRDLTFLFADGAFDIYLPMVWRMDKDFRPFKIELAWLKELPTQYLNRHIRFLTHSKTEGPRDPAAMAEFMEIWGGERLAIFGSEYPYWDYEDPHAALTGLKPEARAAIMGGNAGTLYRIAERTGAGAATA